MRVETHIIDEIFVRRFRGENSRYALVISHGIGAHGGIYDRFCLHHAAKGADIWSYDAPGHGQSTTNRPRGQWTMAEWADAAVNVAEHAKAETGLPVFSLGSSLGVAAAFSSLHADAVSGGILMGSPAVPSGPAVEMAGVPWRDPAVQNVIASLGRAARVDIGLMFNFDEDYGYAGAGEQKRNDPWNTWSYDLASWSTLFTYQPKIKADENKKPILVACGAKDPSFPEAVMKMVADAISGPVQFTSLPEGTHQLMLFHTEAFSAVVEAWVEKYL